MDHDGTGQRPDAAHSRERRVAATFVRLADTLVDHYDVVDLLQTLTDASAELLDASAAGLLLVSGGDSLDLVASTSEESRLIDTIQVSSGNGPSIECFETGKPVAVDDIETTDGRWPEFREQALAQGFRAVHAVPLRLRDSVIGCLTLFRSEPGAWSAEDASVARGFADVATIGILHERALRQSNLAQEQLQYALDSRVVIEQAKGVVSQLRNVSMDEAFSLLRNYSRSHNLALREVAGMVVSRSLEV